MHLDIETLSRIQFAFTVMFHYLYPPLSIGLATIIVIMETLWLKTKNPLYERMCHFWVRVFALNFSIGVATGIVMQFEFGTNWAAYSRYVGDVFGSALAAEGIFAFFLESGFLAVLLFGWKRVSPKMHLFSTIMVCLGATFSAFWITVANSWMQTPAGFSIVGEGMNAHAVVTSYWQMIFNPSAVWRFAHVVVGAWLTGAFFVMSVSAFYLLKKRHLDFARRSFTIALVVAALSSVGQAWVGSKQAEIVAEYQPQKLAAMEGLERSGGNQPFWIIGIPDPTTGHIRYGIKVPNMVSILLTGKADGQVQGIDKVAPEDRPPLIIVFEAYHFMIGIGMYLMGLSWLGLLLLWRKRLFESRFMMWVFMLSVAGPYLANQLGWIAAETGRQPWIVWGLLRTSEGLSHSVGAHAVMASLILFSFIYALLFMVFIYSLDRKIKHGPEEPGSTHHDDKTDGKSDDDDGDDSDDDGSQDSLIKRLVKLAAKRLDPAKHLDEEGD